MKKSITITLFLTLLSGCDHSEVVYTLESETVNFDHCESEGEPIEFNEYNHRYFIISEQHPALFSDMPIVMSCSSPEMCLMNIQSLREGGQQIQGSEFIMELLEGNSEDGYTGFSFGAGVDENGVCVGGRVETYELQFIEDHRPILQQKITYADDYVPDRPGQCDTLSARDAAEGNECSEYRIYYGAPHQYFLE